MIQKIQGKLAGKAKRWYPGIIFFLVIFFTNINVLSAGFSQADINPIMLSPTDSAVQVTNLDGLFTFAKDSIFALLGLVVVAVFIFIGARLVIARGNPEEFKKALLQFVYAVVGLFVVSIAYLAIQLVSSLSIN